ncbi:hypothetical protein CEXT_758571, partial [Caerostris extrusa]
MIQPLATPFSRKVQKPKCHPHRSEDEYLVFPRPLDIVTGGGWRLRPE